MRHTSRQTTPALIIGLLATGLFTLLASQPHAYANNNVDSFNDQVLLGDGKNGRTFAQWSREVQEHQVVRLSATVQKVKGGTDTFLNLRFGRDGALEGGRKAFLPNTQVNTLQWQVNEAPRGRPLVINAYNGEVRVIAVQVTYANAFQSGGNRPRTKPTFGGNQNTGNQNTGNQNTWNNNQNNQNWNQNNAPGSINTADTAICQQGNYRSPGIEVSELKSSGGPFSGEYRVLGSVQGTCIQEAGYFEKGRIKKKITFPYSGRFQRQEFNFKIRSGRGGEIRIYAANGSEDRADIDQIISQSRQNQNSGNTNNNQGGGLGGLLDSLGN